jgi:hypothetical protein
MVNFADALNTPAGEIERPPLIPVGSYIASVVKVPSMETIGDGNWDVLDFQFRLIQAMDDVDQSDLAAYGGLNPTSILRRRFMFNKNDSAAFKRTLFDLRRFLTDHLKVPGDEGTLLSELINNSVNQSCVVFVKWRADRNDPELFYNEIAKTGPSE